NYKTPYVQNYDFLVEHDLGKWGLVGSVGYSGNVGRQIPFQRELNSAAPGTGVFGQPFNVFFGRTAATLQNATGLTSFYNALQAQLTKRFSQGLSFTVAYTYSRAIDHGGWLTPLYGFNTTQGLPPLLNNLNGGVNYGPANWDRTNMFNFSH